MKRMVVGGLVALALAAAACSAPGDAGAGATEVAQASSEAMTTLSTTSTTTTLASTTLSTTTTCASTDPCYGVAPSYVIKLADGDGASWWPNYKDGYSVAFPTPWVSADPSATKPYAYDPNVAAYEKLIGVIPSHVGHEYLVKNVVTYACTNPITGGQALCVKGWNDHQYFMVGFTNNADLATAQNDAKAYASVSDVQSQILQCVHVVTGTLNYGGIVYETGESYVFGDEHDPTTHPW